MLRRLAQIRVKALTRAPIALAALIIQLWTSPAIALDPGPIELSFDIDWTLVADMAHGGPADPARIVEVQGHPYRIAEGVEELFTRLAKDPRVKISFFSGGKLDRNRELLGKIHLRDGSGRNLSDIGRVLSYDDLTQIVPDPENRLSMTQKFRKALTRIAPGARNVVHFDDQKSWSMPGEENRLIWLGETYNAYETFEEAKRALDEAIVQGADTRYIPKSREEWLRDRYKISWIADAIETALRDPRINDDSPGDFVDIVRAKLKPPDAGCGALYRALPP